MMDKKEFLALLYIKTSGDFGELQTIGVSVNYNLKTVRKEDIKEDLIRIATLAGSSLKKTSVVASQEPFPHGFVDLFFENEILVRYSFTATKAVAYKDWRLYLTNAEAYLRENKDTLEILAAKPESKPTLYSVQELAEGMTEKAISEANEAEITNIVEELLG